MSGFFIVYILAVRPMRAFFSEKVVYQGVFSSEPAMGNALTVIAETRSVLIEYMNGGTEMSITYIPQFGFFFLLAMIGIIFFLPSWRIYAALVSFHAVVEIGVIVMLWVGIHLSVFGFILSDFLMLYLSPLVSLGFVVFVSVRKRSRGIAPG